MLRQINGKMMGKLMGTVLFIIGLAMLPALLMALILKEQEAFDAFLITVLLLLSLGAFLMHQMRRASPEVRSRDGILAVCLCWMTACLAGTLPYLLSGELTSFSSAIFESVSGFTTTGATIFVNVEVLPKSLLFWRAFSQWLGGMGILIFAVSLFPLLGISGQVLAQAEIPGPMPGKIATKISDSAKLLYLMYVALTLLCMVLLMLFGTSRFDASIIAFGSVASAGLSNYNDGIAHFDSPAIETIVCIFTIISCVNFSLYYAFSKGKYKTILKDTELRIFLLILSLAAILVTWNLYSCHMYDSFLKTLQNAFFQVTAFITTTGHSNADFYTWPAFSKGILFTLMFIGGCSCSTGGSIKIIRIIVLFKLIWRGFYRKLHPSAMFPVKLKGIPLSSDMVSGVTAFIVCYLCTFLLGALGLSFENFDIMTTLSASAATLSNTGTGLGLMGTICDYSRFSAPSKLLMSFLMLMGRLELFTVLALFSRSFWNEDRLSS